LIHPKAFQPELRTQKGWWLLLDASRAVEYSFMVFLDNKGMLRARFCELKFQGKRCSQSVYDRRGEVAFCASHQFRTKGKKRNQELLLGK
jgi:hypothetical protein